MFIERFNMLLAFQADMTAKAAEVVSKDVKVDDFTEGSDYWFPVQASTFAPEVDSFFYFILYLCIFFFVIIVAGMVYCAVKFRDRPGYKGDPEALHNTPLEVTWTVIPTFLVIYIFVRGTMGYLEMSQPPAGTLDIDVLASQWNWAFTYPNQALDEDLHIPVGKPVKLRMRSKDVLHSLFIPAFRAKADVIPGRYNDLWFQATRTGTFRLFCTEYCGDEHSKMFKKVVVHEQADYDKWVAEAAKAPEGGVELGQWLYVRRGCKSCHSIDGSKVVGPSFKGSWGKEVKLGRSNDSTKTAVFDDTYVRESILEPSWKARDGYQNASAMPTFQGQLKDEQIQAIIEFMKSLKD